MKSLMSFLKDVANTDVNCKYIIDRVDYGGGGITVTCEVVDKNIMVDLKLNDIINDNKLKFFKAKDAVMLSKIFGQTCTESKLSTQKDSRYYTLITVLFSALLLLSNLAEAKICNFLGYTIGAGTIIFPLLYVLNDVLTEVYGFMASRRTIWTALCINCFASLFIYLVILLPASEYWKGQEAFEETFLVSPRIVIASVVSYFIGELLNSILIASLKIRFQGRYFAIRAIFSTIIGSLTESVIFGLIAFGGRIPSEELFDMIILLTAIKIAYEVIVMPFTIRLVDFLKVREGINVFEKPSFKGLLPEFAAR